MDFSQLLKKYRRFSGFSQQELADQIGFGRTTISYWETDRSLPDKPETVLKIAQVLNLYPQDVKATNSLLQAAGFAPKKIIGEDTYVPTVSALSEQGDLAKRDKNFYSHIKLPRKYIYRNKLIKEVSDALLHLFDDAHTSESDMKIFALHGMGGIGKTALARALCDEESIQEKFSDGILWATLGKTPNTKGILV